MNILFVCTMGKMRSATAAALFKGHPIHTARCAGTSPKSKKRLTYSKIEWADYIIPFEKGHYGTARALGGGTRVAAALNIQDRYSYMNKELVELLKSRLGFLLKGNSNGS